jgi:hypothetical protein
VASLNLARLFADKVNAEPRRIGTVTTLLGNGTSEVSFSTGGSIITLNQLGLIGDNVLVQDGIIIQVTASLTHTVLTAF